ncbi:glycosyltransferase family 2 protein [Acinetobacter sp. BSP-28]|uniref:glycosyltransferase family 2 protein n=1 Tax=Acinetobacter sp. BSP-28 TaxID=3344661 RepID=UPI00376F9993
MLNIVIPMAGAGSRFVKAGYVVPKPLIKIHGKSMIQLVVNNLRPNQPHRFIFICQAEHVKKYNLIQKLTQWAPSSVVVEIENQTEGAACTVLAAKEFIDDLNPLMIANSDQYVDICIDSYLNYLEINQLDGLIMTMKATDPKWSFVRLNEENLVSEVIEKKVISNEATVGIYNYARGCDFVEAAEKMIKDNDRVNNEFYVAPVYSRLIQQGRKIGIYNIGSEAHGMYGLGIPQDLDLFLSLPISKKVTGMIT